MGALENFLHIAGSCAIALKFVDIETPAVDGHHFFEEIVNATRPGRNPAEVFLADVFVLIRFRSLKRR